MHTLTYGPDGTISLQTRARTKLPVPRPGRHAAASSAVASADVLAGRKTVGTIDGAVAFAGVKPTPEFLRRYTGYVEQFGALSSTFPTPRTSVQSSLECTARVASNCSLVRASVCYGQSQGLGCLV